MTPEDEAKIGDLHDQVNKTREQLSRYEQRQMTVRRWTVKIAQVGMVIYLTWQIGYVTGSFNGSIPSYIHVFAGMHIQYLIIFGFGPWVDQRRTENNYATIRKVDEP